MQLLWKTETIQNYGWTKLCLDPFSSTEHPVSTLLNFLSLHNVVTTFKVPFIQPVQSLVHINPTHAQTSLKKLLAGLDQNHNHDF